jgi:uncharacterized protein (DUF934 family)
MSEQLIKNRQIVADDLAAGDVLIPAELWLAQRNEWQARNPVGVSIPAGFDVERLADDLPRFTVIAVEFPKFADGRGYSTARLLRERYGYQGELRAVGDVGKDQLFLLSRVGFDAFLIPAHRDAQEALKAFDDFPETYQAATDQPLPLFRRRA